MEGELAEMGKFIGAGLAAFGLAGSGIAVGNIVSSFLAGALRNPSAAPGQTANLFVGIAFAEALGIFSFLIALLLIFVA
ncbi:MAG: F0F1 ATP synthase subunit C [Rhodobacter sp.]|nr:F0F1 ATP synthase subunit C [Rhodobacter sp.]MBS3979456.1 F0F1 ATP synthase subunit C [Paracoccaceae bacterium]